MGLHKACVVLLALVSLGAAGCASSRKLQVREDEGKSASVPREERASTLEEAHVLILELEREVEILEKKTEEIRAASELEIAEVTETYENLLRDLREEVERGEIGIAREGGGITLQVAEEVFFETGKAVIRERGRQVLLRISANLKTAEGRNIRVEGHTDNVPIGPSLKPEFPTNWELAAARAVNVVRFLQEEGGIDPRRLSAVAFAQYRPVGSNATQEGRKKNRRVEIILVDRAVDMAPKVKADF